MLVYPLPTHFLLFAACQPFVNARTAIISCDKGEERLWPPCRLVHSEEASVQGFGVCAGATALVASACVPL